MDSIQVRVHAPHSSHSLMNKYEHELWVFRCLTFYACPVQTPQGSRNILTMQLLQVNTLTNEARNLLIDAAYDAGPVGNAIRIDVTPVSSVPLEATMEKRFWTTPRYERSEGSNKAERVEYTHKDLLSYLRDPLSQQRLLNNATSGIIFWLNLVKYLAELRLIAPDSAQAFWTMAVQLGFGSRVPNRTG